MHLLTKSLEAYMAAGTVRIKDKAGEEVIGTVRLKKGEEFGTVSFSLLGTLVFFASSD